MGLVKKEATVQTNNNGDSSKSFGSLYLHVVRGVRDAHDNVNYMKHDHPLIVSMNPKIVEKMSELKPFNIVFVKGTVNTKSIPKKSNCPNCGTLNAGTRLLTYVTPIFIKKFKECASYEEALVEIIKARELSNQVIVTGNLIQEPKYFQTKHGTLVTQYQIYTTRKFRVIGDNLETKTDYPWIKSYGAQAIEDRLRLQKGSTVIVDGYIQGRIVNRKTKCSCCQEIYPWKDQTMEIASFDVEHIKDYKTDEILSLEEGKKVEDLRNELYRCCIHDEMSEDMNTDDIIN
ncbi:single-stranded DNA-binding protein [Falcatimonas sp. MSJ-15]|uniref:single-stranded DNA-binding protein n=1 Tax=Falcatimonas sp. MSJ-15 TaxID=2841515 RepID=UPI001C1123F8|nr:single-stranded DNA-binding protein [Falcatimonas sp. MSJ-15]MBU5469911.1 single-stranded DNA-binding protein [Falcatimonas sp. MSJ-15]